MHNVARSLPWTLWAGLLLVAPAHGETARDPLLAQIRCIKELRAPTVNDSSWVSNNPEEKVAASVRLNDDGSIESLSVSGGSASYRQLVETGLKKSKFSAGCLGVTVQLAFTFRVYALPLPSHPPPPGMTQDTFDKQVAKQFRRRTWFEYFPPNHFVICIEVLENRRR